MENRLPLFGIEDFKVRRQSLGHGYSLMNVGLWGKEEHCPIIPHAEQDII
jgi:hypothetical protein